MDQAIDGDHANVCVDRTMRTLSSFVNDPFCVSVGKNQPFYLTPWC